MDILQERCSAAAHLRDLGVDEGEVAGKVLQAALVGGWGRTLQQVRNLGRESQQAAWWVIVLRGILYNRRVSSAHPPAHGQ